MLKCIQATYILKEEQGILPAKRSYSMVERFQEATAACSIYNINILVCELLCADLAPLAADYNLMILTPKWHKTEGMITIMVTRV